MLIRRFEVYVKMLVGYFRNFIQLLFYRSPFVKNILCIRGTVFFALDGNFLFGDGIKINSGQIFNPIGGDAQTNIIIHPNAILSISDNVGISNSTIFCTNSISIGADVLLGGGTRIYDTDFHCVSVYDRGTSSDTARSRSKPVTIGNGAFIGAHSIILKGVTVGERAVIQAGSLVHCSIPDDEIWGGNPIKFLKKINHGVQSE
jgi:acetyltransferase-like isoleucine patch superfamily enzyme